MSEDIKPENYELISSAFMTALKALVAEKTESLVTKVTIESGTYLLSITIKELGEK